MSKLILDWSVICHRAWHTMFSANYVATDDEVVEWTRNVAKEVIYLTTRFEADEIVFAMDAPSNWRADYVKDWYHTKTDFYMDVTNPNHWYVKVDKKVREIKYSDITCTWSVSKALSAKDETVLELDNAQMYYHFKEGVTPEIVLEQWPNVPKHVTLLKSWEGIQLAIPYYKGTRSTAPWPAKTPKKTFKALIPELGNKLAMMVQAKPIMVNYAEGDDVIATIIQKWAKDSPDELITLVSVDADLKQLFVTTPSLMIYEPTKRVLFEESPDKANFQLILKILGGDTSDNIKGVSFKKKRGTFPTVSFDAETGEPKGGKTTINWVKSIVDEAEKEGLKGQEIWSRVYRTIEKEAVLDTYYRNLVLVYLSNLPIEITSSILDMYDNIELEDHNMTWKSFEVGDQDLTLMRKQAILDVEGM